MIYHYCSNGDRVNESTIKRNLSKAYHLMEHFSVCQCCGIKRAEGHDHTISRKRCKHLHKTELIWNPHNMSYSDHDCHNEWESYTNGEFQKHKNVVERMIFVRQHDPEGFRKRINYITDIDILQQIHDS